MRKERVQQILTAKWRRFVRRCEENGTKTVRFGGKIDILVNNAGIDPPGDIVKVEVNQ
jgi:NAD(P)-dependent dehydrogenase (short-subunit alcohol dehydrogenase family)